MFSTSCAKHTVNVNSRRGGRSRFPAFPLPCPAVDSCFPSFCFPGEVQVEFGRWCRCAWTEWTRAKSPELRHLRSTNALEKWAAPSVFLHTSFPVTRSSETPRHSPPLWCAGTLFRSVRLFWEEVLTSLLLSHQRRPCVASVLIIHTCLLSEQIHVKNALWIQFKRKF